MTLQVWHDFTSSRVLSRSVALAIEDASNRFILPFVRELLEHGEVIHHIPPNLTSQYRARLSRKKNDVVDASNAARALLANPELPVFQPSQSQREFQDLTRTQRRLSEQLKGDCQVVLGYKKLRVARMSDVILQAAQAAVRKPDASQEKVTTSKREHS